MNSGSSPSAQADSAGVRFEEIPTRHGFRLGIAQLNAEKSLNALSLPMIRALDPQLRRWANDPEIACVILHGAGEKAFCAGGDIRSLYNSLKEQPGALPHPVALDFFAEEYRLDYLIHRYPKPLLVWGSGIVLGGGLGLMAGASHRVVTETSRLAMPEVTIGLFPDVGASWFLRRMPIRLGLFMAITGVQINGRDAVVGGLADHFLRAGDREALLARLPGAGWTADATENRKVLSALLREFASQATGLMPASNFKANEQEIQTFCRGDSAEEIVSRIARYDGDEEWLQRAAKTLVAGSPTSAVLGFELQRRAQHLDLADTLRLELIVSLHCCARPDFVEGVRALLIDKDHQPQWQPRTLAEVTPEWIDGHFIAPAWPGSKHPLADL
ncbi:enoyl-CoA hydratase/isomerase family protein [Peristeroidobacter soli]|jgi:enoyl-CoA hydratase/carnithine racemase|uniref:enoyl-CoA hydratase/isomerase family protein n=1 Tax=Peristeroidobacter soli TaxID=2497877 RepID=UPI00101CAB17|nr:enoyl-CoA hydratase/isomerase family protein [Peristeroidobacter soli]